MVSVGHPLRPATRVAEPAAGQALVRVVGCGVCHTDLGFLYAGVPTRHPLPLILGHEISGVVEAAGEGARAWVGKQVVVPAVIPCGTCALCRKGRGSICPKQVFPGNDLDGGFATHVVVPANGLCEVPPLDGLPVDLEDLSVVADAVTTPYQAILRSRLEPGDVAIFVGVGGVGGFGVQIAKAFGAHVVAIDVDDVRLARMREHGADLALNAQGTDAKALKKQVRDFAKQSGAAPTEWKIFETSGTVDGQQAAFGMLVHGAYLSIVGFTPKKVEVCLSHLMAFDAQAEGSWGCLPEHYPPALDLVLKGKVQLGPFVTRRPLASINDTLEAIRAHTLRERVVLVPALD
jgi:6-hydroxycyclohex-1-ene-1-carbonyl-CoA dehydrogenase